MNTAQETKCGKHCAGTGLCTKKIATKEDLRREIKELRTVGKQLANMAYHYGQESVGNTVSAHDKQGFAELCRAFDDIQRAE